MDDAETLARLAAILPFLKERCIAAQDPIASEEALTQDVLQIESDYLRWFKFYSEKQAIQYMHDELCQRCPGDLRLAQLSDAILQSSSQNMQPLKSFFVLNESTFEFYKVFMEALEKAADNFRAFKEHRAAKHLRMIQPTPENAGSQTPTLYEVVCTLLYGRWARVAPARADQPSPPVTAWGEEDMGPGSSTPSKRQTR